MNIFKKLFKRKESAEETSKRLSNLCEYDGISFPSLDADKALSELCNHFLGDDWYCVNPIHATQVNAVIVYEIERKYPRKVVTQTQKETYK